MRIVKERFLFQPTNDSLAEKEAGSLQKQGTSGGVKGATLWLRVSGVANSSDH